MAESELLGGPGAVPEPASDPAPAPMTYVRVQMGGRTFEVPADMAEAYQQEQSRWRAPTPPPATPATAPAAPFGDDLATIWYTNPQEAARRVQAQTESRLTAQFEAYVAQQTFWQEFHNEHPVLQREDALVRYVLTARPDLASLPANASSRAQLAQAVLEQKATWLQQQGSSSTSEQGASIRVVPQSRAPRIEGPGGGGRPSAAPVEPQPQSLSAQLEAWRAARTAARTRRQA